MRAEGPQLRLGSGGAFRVLLKPNESDACRDIMRHWRVRGGGRCVWGVCSKGPGVAFRVPEVRAEMHVHRTEASSGDVCRGFKVGLGSRIAFKFLARAGIRVSNWIQLGGPPSFDVAVFGGDEPWVLILGGSGRLKSGRVWQRAASPRRVLERG